MSAVVRRAVRAVVYVVVTAVAWTVSAVLGVVAGFSSMILIAWWEGR